MATRSRHPFDRGLRVIQPGRRLPNRRVPDRPIGSAMAEPIVVTCRADEATRTPNSSCIWIAEATVEGRTYTARSRHGAPNELARRLVVAGIADRPMMIRYHGLAGAMTYPSFRAAAAWTFSEGDRPLRRTRYREQPEGVFPSSGTGQKCVSSTRPMTTWPARPRMSAKSSCPLRPQGRAAAKGATANFCPLGGGPAFAPPPAGCGLIARLPRRGKSARRPASSRRLPGGAPRVLQQATEAAEG